LLPREKHTERLVRILTNLDAGRTPFAVKSLHVFGSYARGALYPRDLDLLVIHEPIPKAMLDAWYTYYEDEHFYSEIDAWRKATKRCMSELSRSIRKPGEKMDILFGTDLKERLQSLIGSDSVEMLWSLNDRNWRSKLDAIIPDPNATSAPRDHLLSLKRLNTNRSTMELLVDAIKHDELSLTRIPIESLPKLNRKNTDRAQWFLKCGHMGKQSAKLLPLAFAWLQSCRQPVDDVDPHSLSAWSKSKTHRIEFGKPNLWHAVWYLRHSTKLKRIAFVAHLKKDEPNEILIFEPGKNWRTEQMEQRERERTFGKK
jgi:predicted nucleotidyltransferase